MTVPVEEFDDVAQAARIDSSDTAPSPATAPHFIKERRDRLGRLQSDLGGSDSNDSATYDLLLNNRQKCGGLSNRWLRDRRRGLVWSHRGKYVNDSEPRYGSRNRRLAVQSSVTCAQSSPES